MNKIDLEIILAIEKGENSKALEHLYDVPLKKIRKYILGNSGSIEEANDVFQDAIVILFNQVKKNKFDKGRGVTGYLYVIAKNIWIDKVRRDKKIELYDTTEYDRSIDTTDLLGDIIKKERLSVLAKMMDQVGERCKKLLTMVNYDKLSMKEISEKLDFNSVDIAKTTHYRCKQKLAKIITGNKEALSILRN